MLREKSNKWTIQKYSLPQGSVMSPIFFNDYTNDQLLKKETEHFVYVDDLAVLVQGDNFENVKNK